MAQSNPFDQFDTAPRVPSGPVLGPPLDPTKQAAEARAQNAGPGRVDQALARGGNNWLDHVPAETRVYVERNMRAVRGN